MKQTLSSVLVLAMLTVAFGYAGFSYPYIATGAFGGACYMAYFLGRVDQWDHDRTER